MPGIRGHCDWEVWRDGVWPVDASACVQVLAAPLEKAIGPLKLSHFAFSLAVSKVFQAVIVSDSASLSQQICLLVCRLQEPLHSVFRYSEAWNWYVAVLYHPAELF